MQASCLLASMAVVEFICGPVLCAFIKQALK